MNYIRSTVDQLTARFGTADPFELCDALEIRLSIEPLPPAIHGFYSNVLNMDFIYINRRLSRARQRLVCAHELGHAVLHPGVNSLFLSRSTQINGEKLERQADLFAAHLLIPDSAFARAREESLTMEQLAAELKLPPSYLELKFSALHDD